MRAERATNPRKISPRRLACRPITSRAPADGKRPSIRCQLGSMAITYIHLLFGLYSRVSPFERAVPAIPICGPLPAFRRYSAIRKSSDWEPPNSHVRFPLREQRSAPNGNDFYKHFSGNSAFYRITRGGVSRWHVPGKTENTGLSPLHRKTGDDLFGYKKYIFRTRKS